MKYKTLLIFFISFIFANHLFATKLKDTVKINDQKIERLHFDQQILKDYKQNRSFWYEEQAIESESWFDRLFWKFWKTMSHLFPESNWKKAIYLIVFIAFLLLVAYVFFKREMPSIFSRNRKIRQLDILDSEIGANINDLDLSIQKAIDKQDYRLAIRYLFSKSLKALDANGLIKWQTNKTNREYTYELKNGTQRSNFLELSNYYEYTWYGNFKVDMLVFSRIQTEFQQFFKSLSLE